MRRFCRTNPAQFISALRYQSGELELELEKVQGKTVEVKGWSSFLTKRQKRLKLSCSLEKRQLSRDMTEVCLFTEVLG